MVGGRKVQIWLVDDHPLYRRGLEAVLGCESDLEVAGEAASFAELRRSLVAEQLDVVVLDVLMPVVSGISVAHEVCELAPHARILALSAIDEPCLIADMLRAGAIGFALKTQPAHEIIDAIRHVIDGRRYLPPGVSRNAIDAELAAHTPEMLGRLTRREREIFELIIRGYANTDIANRLFIAPRTVETHRLRVMKKLSARSIVEMQRLALRYGGI